MIDQIICGDCLEIMPRIPDKSVDMVLADLPYGVTACKWDTPLPLDELWREWVRICDGVVVLTATQPFTSVLVTAKLELFKHAWVWQKANGTNFLNTKSAPFKIHEDILVFSDWYTLDDVNNFVPLRRYFHDFQDALGITLTEITRIFGRRAVHCFSWDDKVWHLPTKETYSDLCTLLGIWGKVRSYEDLRRDYDDLRQQYKLRQQHIFNPQMEAGAPYIKKTGKTGGEYIGGVNDKGFLIVNNGTRKPRSIIAFNSERGAHPTQKPVALFEYLIKTYTNEGDTVLDPTCGSGTTAVACKRSDRHYICIEKEQEYCAIAEKRLAEML